MKRARAAKLVLVNWKGVFYERYELDESVTALEGENGAGKTTVLIAAFIALLPDMKHLRFANVGEQSSTGGDRGIWGRLGETGRPSYTVLDIELANGERLLAGVHLERRSEPTVEPTPLFITGLPPDTELQTLFLVRDQEIDAVPELEELRHQAARHGATLHRCESAKEYFGTLFDRGITPLRLDGDAERAKLAEMLRTSMTGGMSQVLTKGLREFLLKEESTLASNLRKMRENMAACRRTRAEVNEAQRLEHEISAVLAAGQEMFNAAVHATKEAAKEATSHTTSAEKTLVEATQSVGSAEEQFKATASEHQRATARLQDLESGLNRERANVRRLDTAWAHRNNIERSEATLKATRTTKSWNSKLDRTEDVATLRTDLMSQRDDAHDKAQACLNTKKSIENRQRDLRQPNGTVFPDLSAITRQLGATLLSTRFEDIALDDAGSMEAQLGPLTNAIVVDDPARAATTVLATENRPDSVWLVTPNAIPEPGAQRNDAPHGNGGSVVVRTTEDVWRVSRVPDRPILGKVARERELTGLERDARHATAEEDKHRRRKAELTTELAAIDEILATVKLIQNERARLAACGIENLSEEAMTNAQAQLAACERDKLEADRARSKLNRRYGTLENELKNAKDRVAAAERTLTEARGISDPAKRRWDALESDAGDLLGPTNTPDVVSRLGVRGSINLYSDARAEARKLAERLAQAQDGDEPAQAIDRLCSHDDRSGAAYLQAWRNVRDWLRRRLPAQIAQMDDPIEALSHFRVHLKDLNANLARQERDLQGESAGIANAIGTHTRRARSTITRLNDDLSKVRFGSIEGVKLELRPVPEMTNILEALRAGDAQAPLLSPELPLEEALDQLFRAHGGRRAQGHKLLDYREYVNPVIQLKRKAATGWETANPNRISTGESIGIGAALMMVVLTAWERAASLLRTDRAHGTLRLLLLDEANRLDKTNLRVLFDLCQTLDLQLLLAAPDVAQAEGNTDVPPHPHSRRGRPRTRARERPAHGRPRNCMNWNDDAQRMAVLELYRSGCLRKRTTQLDAWRWLADLAWTTPTRRRNELALIETHRNEIERVLDLRWPAWKDVANRLDDAGLPITHEGWKNLKDAERTASKPALPRRLNHKTATAQVGPHSKASLTGNRRNVLADVEITRDDVVRLRPNAGLALKAARPD